MAKNKRKNTNNQQTGFNAMPWVAGALFVLGIAVLAGMYWDRTVVVGEIRFDGNYFVPQDKLERQVEIPTGIPPDSLDFLNIIGQVEKIDYVKQAAVNVEPSGDLMIEISERKPIALLADGEQKIYVDEDGIRLPLILGKAVDVPLLYGFESQPMTDTLKSEAWRQARNFLVEMNNRPVSDATISEVAWTTEEGIVALSHENGVKLVFGSDEFGSRLRNWEAFYSEVIREKGIRAMRSVDLRFKGQIVTRES